MPEHNFISDLIGSITLPLLLLIALAVMAGVKPNVIASGFLSVVIAGLKLSLQVAVLAVKLLTQLVQSRAALDRQQRQRDDHIVDAADVKIIVDER